MTWELMKDLCYEMTHTSDEQIGDWTAATWDTRVFKYLSFATDRFWSAYCSAHTGFKIDGNVWTQELTSGTTTYSFDSTIKKLNRVSVSYDGSTYDTTGKIKYCAAREVDINNLAHDWYFYEENQPESDPIYYISNNKYTIAPSPTTTVTNWLKEEGVAVIPAITTSTTEAQVIVPPAYHHIIVQGALPYIYRKQGKLAQANAEMKEYERMEREALIELSDFHQWPMYAHFPDEVHSIDTSKQILG